MDEKILVIDISSKSIKIGLVNASNLETETWKSNNHIIIDEDMDGFAKHFDMDDLWKKITDGMNEVLKGFNPNKTFKSTNHLKDFIRKLELQALETAEERIPLYLEVGLKDAKSILDVGCGSGIVTKDIARLTKGKVIGIDGSNDMIKVAANVLKNNKSFMERFLYCLYNINIYVNT